MTGTADDSAKTRRTEGVRTMGRAARVVESVLRATAQELARVGYAALRVDEVAEISGVNKTTIYRRWPTKVDLTMAALRLSKPPPAQDTGDLRKDVLAWILEMLEFAASPIGSGLIRVMQTERGHPEIEAIARKLRKEQRAARVALVERAIARGELPKGVDAHLLGDLLFIPMLSRSVNDGERLDPRYVERAVDLVLAGARASATSSGSARSRSGRPRSAGHARDGARTSDRVRGRRVQSA